MDLYKSGEDEQALILLVVAVAALTLYGRWHVVQAAAARSPLGGLSAFLANF